MVHGQWEQQRGGIIFCAQQEEGRERAKEGRALVSTLALAPR
eukprot:COSAG01_NODE_43_length_32320_cov_622.744763_29_plen_42_part_00